MATELEDLYRGVDCGELAGLILWSWQSITTTSILLLFPDSRKNHNMGCIDHEKPVGVSAL
jgi:hypothetical protein